MGQGESKPTVKAEPVQQPVEKTPSSSNIQIPRIKQKPLVSDSLVAGSPLSTVEHYSTQQDVDQQMRRIQIAEPRFVQPPGEPSYKNSSKIVHSFGPGGIGFAPLQPLNKQPSKNTPVIITWAHGGNAVFLTGSFNNWKQKIRLQKSTQDFTTVVDMPPGKHNLKFIVDDEWKCSEDLPTASDADGNLVNYIEVAEDAMDDGLDFLGKEEDLGLYIDNRTTRITKKFV
ncbi:immunoglobulin E-set [Gorgonomyces haynaldii]|nr:immunoglobulin E-set [Gorgonomyces haynaldii]